MYDLFVGILSPRLLINRSAFVGQKTIRNVFEVINLCKFTFKLSREFM